MRSLLVALFCLPLVVACGDKASDPAAKDGPDKAAVKADPMPDFAKAALAAMKPVAGGVEFTTAKVDKDRVLAVTPKGWEESKFMPGNFKPPKDADLGFMTNYSAGSNCDGICAAKDWKATAEKVNLGQFREAEKFELLEDRALTGPTGHLIVARSKGGFGQKIYVAAARWKDGASRYYTCSATLDGDKAVALAKAFATACETNRATFLE